VRKDLNMADTTITIPDLGSLTSGQASDLLLATRGTTGYKMLLSDLAKYMVETYNSSSLAGSAQSVKNALDSLNSRTNGLLTPITVEGISLTNCAYTSNPFCAMVKFSITVTTAPSDWVKILSGAPSRANFPSGTNSNAFFYFSNFGSTSYIKIYVTNNGDIYARCFGTGTTVDITLVYPR
jgi:hypothetical protein